MREKKKECLSFPTRATKKPAVTNLKTLCSISKTNPYPQVNNKSLKIWVRMCLFKIHFFKGEIWSYIFLDIYESTDTGCVT